MIKCVIIFTVLENTNTMVEYRGLIVDTERVLRGVRLAVQVCPVPRQVYGADISDFARQNGALWIAFGGLFPRIAGEPAIGLAQLVSLGHDLIEEVGGVQAYADLYDARKEFPEVLSYEPMPVSLQQNEAVA